MFNYLMSKIKQQLKEFYDAQAEKFSNTRKKLWPEFFYIAEEISKLLSTQEKVNILELWCGDGRLYRFLAERFPGRINYVGVDLSENLIKLAKESLELRAENWEYVLFINSDMLSYLEKEDSLKFDFVIGVASFQHIPTNWERLLILKHVYRVLKYGDKVILFNWSFSSWFFKKYFFQILKSFLIFLFSLWVRPMNDVYVPWKDWEKVYYRYYHIFFLFELKRLLKQAWFVVQEVGYINRNWEKTVSRMNSRNSYIIWVKSVLNLNSKEQFEVGGVS